jgi:hypothetical protein
LITFRLRQIAVAKLEDENEARSVIEELKEIVNETYVNREHIKPTYTSRPAPDLLMSLNFFRERTAKNVENPLAWPSP